MAWFKITLAYDGAEFCGWQAQPQQRTVQGAFEQAWRDLTGEDLRVTVSGRTDAGVHAVGQVVGLESQSRLELDAIRRGLNRHLPLDVVVVRAERAPEGFHATTDAVRKRYRYLIYNDRRRPVFWRQRAWHVPVELDRQAMQAAADVLVGTHDFASFQTVGSPRQSTVRTLFAVDVLGGGAGEGRPDETLAPWTWETDSLIAIDVTGDGFLYNMVRAIAGTLVRAGRRRLTPEGMGRLLERRERAAAGQTAPAYALTLMEVEYLEPAVSVSQNPRGD
jgi:tRNA pseudouridine38-40 synthase